MEATSSYWVALATTLAQQGDAVAVINPHQAHSCAKALLQRAKTDARDARMLAHLAATLQPTPWTPPPAIYTALQQCLAERGALIALRQQVRTQRHALEQLPVVVDAMRARMGSCSRHSRRRLRSSSGRSRRCCSRTRSGRRPRCW